MCAAIILFFVGIFFVWVGWMGVVRTHGAGGTVFLLLVGAVCIVLAIVMAVGVNRGERI